MNQARNRGFELVECVCVLPVAFDTGNDFKTDTDLCHEAGIQWNTWINSCCRFFFIRTFSCRETCWLCTLGFVPIPMFSWSSLNMKVTGIQVFSN